MVSLLLAVMYLTFISLGLPDGLLGAAWPAMHTSLDAPVAAQSVVSLIISGCTIVSSLLTARLVARLGTGKLCALSVALTAIAILGFSQVNAFWQMCALAVPYGLGAGAIDAALNNYVALHFGPRHMSWLHCCWGIGASAGPVVMGWALGSAFSWPAGYLVIGSIQVAIAFVLFLSLPLWRGDSAPHIPAVASSGSAAVRTPADSGHDGSISHTSSDSGRDSSPTPVSAERADSTVSGHATATARASTSATHIAAGVPVSAADALVPTGGTLASSVPRLPLTNRELLRLPGAKATVASFGVYCALESSTGLWIASYLVMARGLDAATAASMVSLFFLGITVGRFVSGAVAGWLNSERQIRVGLAAAGCGLAVLLLTPGAALLWCGVALVGLGCAPIYPSIVALTPHRFGDRASQGMVSLQMACAYAGSSLVPPVFGLVAGVGCAHAVPWMLAALLIADVMLCEAAAARTR